MDRIAPDDLCARCETVRRLRGLVDWLCEDPDNLALLPPQDVEALRAYLERNP